MAIRVLLRKDTAANWTAANPILGEGEIGVEKNTLKYKIGDGLTNWNTLAYGFNNDPVAGDIFYDNTTSGLTATDIQNAIDEMMEENNTPPPTTHTQSESIKSAPTGTVDGTVDNFEETGLSLVNSVENGDFSDGIVGWSAPYASISVNNNILTAEVTTPSSANRVEQAFNNINLNAGDVWFIYNKFTPKYPIDGRISFGDISYSKSVTANVANEIYTKDTMTAVGNILRFYHNTLDYSVGETYTIDGNAGVHAINMTALGIEDFTEEQMLDLVRSGYIDGLQSIMRPTVESVGKNLFDVNKIDNGRINASTGLNDDTYNGYRYANYIHIKDLESYIQSGNPIIPFFTEVYYYDYKKDYIEHESITTAYFTSPSNCKYVRLVRPTSSKVGSAAIKEELNYFQLEEGTTVTEYEPHKSSQLTADVPLRRVPNGVEDRVYESDGQMWEEKNVEEYVLQNIDFYSLDTTYTNIDFVLISKANLTGYAYIDVYNNTLGDMLFGKYPQFGGTAFDDVQYEWKFNLRVSNGYIILVLPKGTYADLASAQTDLAGTKIHYQLATPQLINLTTDGLTTGELQAYENGTIYQSSDTFHSPALSFDVASNRASQIESLLESANAQSKQIDAKANKVQEDWIEPTLLNGWVNYSSNISKYYKNDFGEVFITFNIQDGTATTGTVLFTLPEGYRPSHNTPIFGVRATDGSLANAIVQNNGNVIIGSNNGTGVFYFNGSFKAGE